MKAVRLYVRREGKHVVALCPELGEVLVGATVEKIVERVTAHFARSEVHGKALEVQVSIHGPRRLQSSESHEVNIALPTSPARDMDLQLTIAKNVDQAVQVYWKRWLWNEEQPAQTPRGDFCRMIAGRFALGESDVREVWDRWYLALTSRDFAVALTGLDLRDPSHTRLQGRSHRRAP